jgi:YegS/Rv2252/BmrU family lipid kinase
VRVHLFINEHSRRGREFGPRVRDAMQSAGIEIVSEGASFERMDRVDAIVCAGGDGTLLCGIEPAIKADVPLGIVPLGTFNELARTLNVPLEPEAAVAAIATGVERRIDVGRVNGRHYLNEASIGISSRVTRLQTPELKQRFGFLGVVWTALQAVRYGRPFHAEIRYDDDRAWVRTLQLTIANSHRFGGLVSVADAAIDDGWLDCYSVDITSMGEAFSVTRHMLAGKREDAPGLRTFRARTFDVVTPRPHHITADGEPAGTTPARFEVLAKALRVFAPQ